MLSGISNLDYQILIALEVVAQALAACMFPPHTVKYSKWTDKRGVSVSCEKCTSLTIKTCSSSKFS